MKQNFFGYFIYVVSIVLTLFVISGLFWVNKTSTENLYYLILVAVIWILIVIYLRAVGEE